MSDELIGKVLRIHADDNFEDESRILLVDSNADAYWCIPLPGKHQGDDGEATGRRRHYIKKIQVRSLSCLLERVKAREWSLVDWECPYAWTLSDSDLLSDNASRVSRRRSRRKLKKWLKRRDQAYELIEPIVKGNDFDHLVRFDLCPMVCQQRAEELEIDVERVKRALRQYLLGMGTTKNALLPAYWNVGNPEVPKHSKTKTGAPNREYKKYSDPRDQGINASESIRSVLRKGWAKYKTDKRSVEAAYWLTMEEYFASSVEYVSAYSKKVKLLPPNARPTLVQFSYHGPQEKPAASASRINKGQLHFDNNQRGNRGKAAQGVRALGQLAWLDSTSEDQRPVSVSSRLILLSSTWRTIVLDGFTDYILGLYCGFEPPSTLTGLLALKNAAEPKAPFAARFGLELGPRDWYSRMPKQVQGDNGDIKSAAGIETMSDAEVSLIFTKAWSARLKGPVEAKHKELHRRSDHLAIGSTRGRPRTRGEPKSIACLNYPERMAHVIETVLTLNNEEELPTSRLTLEMRKDGIERTRRGMYEWAVAKGYVASEPVNLDLLVAQCLPRFQAVIKRDGVHLYDPRLSDPTARLIPDLCFWSEWLYESGKLDRGTKLERKVMLYLDPTQLREAYVNIDGIRKLRLSTLDSQLGQLSLSEWVQITDDDALKRFVQRGALGDAKASLISSAEAINARALDQKKKEVGETTNQTEASSGSAASKRRNTKSEVKQQRLEQAGLSDPKPAQREHVLSSAPPDLGEDVDPHAREMELLRANRISLGGASKSDSDQFAP